MTAVDVSGWVLFLLVTIVYHAMVTRVCPIDGTEYTGNQCPLCAVAS